jgi:hypothetical protein
MKNIYFTEKFISDINDERAYIELKKYKLGKFSELNSESIEKPSDINLDYMYSKDITSPTDGTYIFSSIYYKGTQTLNMNIQVPSYDESISESNNSESYKILYILYKNQITLIEDIAFIIYDKVDEEKFKLNDLSLSKNNNLINIEIPIKCEVITYNDSDIEHLESSGVSYKNIYSIPKGTNYNYINKDSFDRYYYKKNKFGSFPYRHST